MDNMQTCPLCRALIPTSEAGHTVHFCPHCGTATKKEYWAHHHTNNCGVTCDTNASWENSWERRRRAHRVAKRILKR